MRAVKPPSEELFDEIVDPASGRVEEPRWVPDWRLSRIPQTLLLGLIRLYQLTLSRMLPAACRFYPTCSRYGFEAIRRYGIGRGGLMAAWRILRCNPFTPGGYDPVP